MRLKTFNLMIVLTLITSSFSLVLLSDIAEAEVREIYVNDDFYIKRDGSAERPYATINKALSEAVDGDIIYVFGGTYNETLVINKQVAIIGSIDEGNTVIYYKLRHLYTIEINADRVTLEGLNITDSGNFIVSEVKGALVKITSNNNIIQRNNITSCPNGWGIYLDSSDGNVIGNNQINGTRIGVYLSNSNTNDLFSNDINNCTFSAVELLNSNNNRMYKNKIDKNHYGIYSKQSSGTNVSSNWINNSGQHGIAFYSNNQDVIVNNNLFENHVYGIHINSDGTKVSYNKIQNSQIAINLDSDNCEVTYNYLNGSLSIGISAVVGSVGNILFENHFNDNYDNVRDKGSNTWYFNGRGNYWDDYKNVDRNLNGIGDFPHPVDIGINDLYPLGIFLRPPKKPFNPSPTDGQASVGLRITLEVNVYDYDGDFMDVYFYDASNDQLMGVKKNAPSGSRADCSFTLPFDKAFAWYVYVNDSKLENRSDIWFFITKARPPENQKPVADTGGPYVAYIDETILFDASKSYDPDGEIAFYRWNFGDGTSEILAQKISHSYSDVGTYDILLTVIDNDGTSSQKDTTVTVVEGSANKPPIAKPGGPYTCIATELVGFDGSESYDSDGSIVNYTWYYGDGAIGYGVTTSHIYSEDGMFLVELKVTDNEGDDSIEEVLITVNKKPGLPGFEFAILLFALVIIFFARKKKVIRTK
ncbi:MAG: PKD domain-containing protein [Candidatus Thermoplasmatota archaeon]|nr:PKD domain-containing protein [Candidatus Thermoplasmatota archaeon]